MRRSSKAPVSRSEPKISVHSLQGRFEVTSVEASKAQRREAAIGCHILNRMAELGRPSSYALGR